MSQTELKIQAHREPLRKDREPQRRWLYFFVVINSLCVFQCPYCLMGEQANDGNELINDQV